MEWKMEFRFVCRHFGGYVCAFAMMLFKHLRYDTRDDGSW
jgi:hypothetical protein